MSDFSISLTKAAKNQIEGENLAGLPDYEYVYDDKPSNTLLLPSRFIESYQNTDLEEFDTGYTGGLTKEFYIQNWKHILMNESFVDHRSICKNETQLIVIIG